MNSLNQLRPLLSKICPPKKISIMSTKSGIPRMMVV
ncbi:Uncharacterised protein [Vibrio cholerae]|nr:Uncharacterised protein [Vibrio cholerae]